MKKISILISVLLVVLFITACTVPPATGQDVPSGGENITEPEDTESGDEHSQGGDEHHVPEKPNETLPLVPLKKYDSILIVTAKNINVRSGKGSKYKVLGTMKKGEGLAMIESDSSGWYTVYYKGKRAYIHGSYVRLVQIERSGDDSLEKVISEGARLLGFPYIYGAQRYHWGSGNLNRNFRYGEFDCSSLMQYMFYKGASVNLSVNTRTQVYDGVHVTGDIRRGDVMFFTNSARRYRRGVERVGHVAIYLGDNYILHTASDYAVIEEISSERWGNYLVSKRMI